MSKRQREYSIKEQSIKKKSHIKNQMLDTVMNFNSLNNNICDKIIINELNIDMNIKNYNVKISSPFGNTQFKCSCSQNVYLNFNNNYCKHISLAITEIIRLYLKDTDNFFKEKNNNIFYKENIEYLKDSIDNINI